MAIKLLLSLLQGVKPTGPSRWVAKCPSHEDRSPSLSLEEKPDGRVLLHCFAGCDAEQVVRSVGLELADLYPEPLYHRAKALPYRVNVMDAFLCLTREAVVVAIAVSDIVEGRKLTDEDADRVATAAGRIAEGMAVIHGA